MNRPVGEHKKDTFLTLKISTHDKQLIIAAARLDDRTMSNWAVRTLVRQAKRELAATED